VSFESDCQQLVQIITSSKAWLALAPELDDIQLLRSSFSLFSLCFISKSLNILLLQKRPDHETPIFCV
ncbi:unnamed protein product, partial [Brassica oleracea]